METNNITTVLDILTKYSDWIKLIVAVGVAIATIRGWVAKPIKKLSDIIEKQDTLLTFLTSDRLATARNYWIRKGFCPEPDRSRLLEMYDAHIKRGKNHLVTSYKEDIEALPKIAPR